jgi:hypothetical protein
MTNRWFQMGEEQVHEKTGHAIRDLIKSKGIPLKGSSSSSSLSSTSSTKSRGDSISDYTKKKTTTTITCKKVSKSSQAKKKIQNKKKKGLSSSMNANMETKTAVAAVEATMKAKRPSCVSLMEPINIHSQAFFESNFGYNSGMTASEILHHARLISNEHQQQQLQRSYREQHQQSSKETSKVAHPLPSPPALVPVVSDETALLSVSPVHTSTIFSSASFFADDDDDSVTAAVAAALARENDVVNIENGIVTPDVVHSDEMIVPTSVATTTNAITPDASDFVRIYDLLTSDDDEEEGEDEEEQQPSPSSSTQFSSVKAPEPKYIDVDEVDVDDDISIDDCYYYNSEELFPF